MTRVVKIEKNGGPEVLKIETIQLDNKFRERMRKTEEKVNFILRQVHKSELSRISEMKNRYEEQLLPLELEAQILQDSLDLLSIQALRGDKTLDSLYKKGVLSEEEYKRKRNEILKGI